MHFSFPIRIISISIRAQRYNGIRLPTLYSIASRPTPYILAPSQTSKCIYIYVLLLFAYGTHVSHLSLSPFLSISVSFERTNVFAEIILHIMYYIRKTTADLLSFKANLVCFCWRSVWRNHKSPMNVDIYIWNIYSHIILYKWTFFCLNENL